MSRAVLFDLDGVLLDSRPTVLAALAGLATAALGRRVTTSDLPPDAAVAARAAVLAELGVAEPNALCEIWWEPALATAAAPRVFPGAVDALMALRDAKVATGLVTLQSRTRLPWLLPPAVLDLLDVAVCWEDADPKPAPDGILLALARLGAAPFDAVFVGDTVSDIAAARAAGVTPVGAGWGFAGPAALAAAGARLVLDRPEHLAPALLPSQAMSPRPTAAGVAGR